MKLSGELERALTERIEFRKHRFLELMKGIAVPSILIVGDKPAPDAPDDDMFHFTPFGAMRHSSLWLNRQLHEADIPEEWLTFVNAADRHGTPTSRKILEHKWRNIIALGGNARRWILPAQVPHAMVNHPQSWKRFHTREEYPLICLLRMTQL
jgi:hypothetical protein